MARRNQHSQEEFHALVMRAVQSHLSNEPASSMSLRKLAKQIGYTPGMLLSVYKSYNLLLLHANAETLDTLYTDLLRACEQQSSHKEKLYALAMAYLQYANNHKHQWQLVFAHKLADDESLPTWMQSRIDRLFGLVGQCLAPCLCQQRQQQLVIQTRTLWASVHGITQLAVDDKLFHQHDNGELMLQLLLTQFIDNGIQENKKA